MNPGAQLFYFHILPAPHQRGNRRTVPQIVDGRGKGIGSIRCRGQSPSIEFSNTRVRRSALNPKTVTIGRRSPT